ncbi:hypothetical protein ACP275_05G007600 [Erythranthe tilingii]
MENERYEGRRCNNVVLKKGPWSPLEDRKLLSYIHLHGHGSWASLPSKAGLKRCGKSCRLRWTNYLRPDIKRGKFNLQEEDTIIQLHALLGNRWSAIAAHLPKRTGNEIKNHWNTNLKKKLIKMGLDPVTHMPINHRLGCAQPKDFANLCHMAQWESARLEAEARLVRRQFTALPPPPPPPCFDVLNAWECETTGGTLINSFFAGAASDGGSSLQYPTPFRAFDEKLAVEDVDDDGGAKGIMDISVELYGHSVNPVVVDDSLGFPRFTPVDDGIAVVGGWWGSVARDDDVAADYWGSSLDDVAFSNRDL